MMSLDEKGRASASKVPEVSRGQGAGQSKSEFCVDRERNECVRLVRTKLAHRIQHVLCDNGVRVFPLFTGKESWRGAH